MNNQQRPIRRGLQETLTVLAVLFAFGSGLSWHLSTLHTDVARLAPLLALENQWAAMGAVISAALLLAAVLLKK